MNYQARANALPDELQSFAGRILDVDSHEMMPAQAWIEECGSICKDLVYEWMHNGDTVQNNPNHSNCPDYEGDNAPIDAATIWSRKGSMAPGAVDMGRRDAVMDVMGIRRQLVFPTGVGLWGSYLIMNHDDMTNMPSIKTKRVEYGKELNKAYIEWALRVRETTDRIQFMLPLIADSVDELMTSARHLVDNGIRGVWLPSNLPPGGRSPAHPDLDPFWKLMVDNNVAVCLHTGPDNPYKTMEWGNAPVFDHYRTLGEFRTDPWALSHYHITARNFLAVMIVGAVFERHPGLRFGCIELGASWVGDLMDSLDQWWRLKVGYGTDKAYRLPNTPSFYIQRNVRISPFDFEPINVFIDRNPLLKDVLCFASDYPHVEGGKDPVGAWYRMLKPYGQDVMEKFFVTNAQWLMPA